MNKLTKKVLIALAATLFTSTAFAANWVQASRSYEVDTQSIQRGSNFTSLWARAEADEPGDPASTYVLFQIKCTTQEIRIRTLIDYSLPKGEGKVVFSRTQDKPFHPIPPGSNADYLHSFVCTSKK